MTTTTGHRLSPHAHDFEDGDERPLPARKVKPLFTVDEVFGWLCDKQHINPDYLNDTRFRWLMNHAELVAAKLVALYAHALTARIEAVYAGETA